MLNHNRLVGSHAKNGQRYFFAISLNILLLFFRLLHISTLTSFNNNTITHHTYLRLSMLSEGECVHRTSSCICQITNKQSSSLSHYTHVRSLAAVSSAIKNHLLNRKSWNQHFRDFFLSLFLYIFFQSKPIKLKMRSSRQITKKRKALMSVAIEGHWQKNKISINTNNRDLMWLTKNHFQFPSNTTTAVHH